MKRFRELGQLDAIFSKKGRGMKPLDKEIRDSEENAKIDVYNYAARFDCVPNFSARRSPRRNLTEVTIELVEQSILVSAKGRDLKEAEIAAALRFKHAAEKYQASSGQGLIFIKDSTALTTDNSRNFCSFYKLKYPQAQITVDFDQGKNVKGVSHSNGAQVRLDGNKLGVRVDMPTKKLAEDLAYLTAAITLKKETPGLFPSFCQAPKSNRGEILMPVPTQDMPLDEDCVFIMRDTIIAVRRAGLPDEANELISDERGPDGNGRIRRFHLTDQQAQMRDWSLQKAYSAYLQDEGLAELRRKRSELPVSQNRMKVLEIVGNNTYSIIVGATGSGKTTQVPQILLEDAISNGKGSACNIICTQPRKIAATSVARRVAVERAERFQDTVGYHVRFDAKLPAESGSITYCTTGILLQQLLHFSDEIMDGVSHLVIDEVHERDIIVDFLLVLLRRLMRQRAAAGQSVPKLVLMSATANTELFASYFKDRAGDGGDDCPVLSVPGRAFPVREIFLESLLDELQASFPNSALRLLESDEATKEYLSAGMELRAQSGNEKALSNDFPRDEETMIDWKQEVKLRENGESYISSEKEDALVPCGLVALTIAHIVRTTSDGAVLVFLPGLDEITKVTEILTGPAMNMLNFRDESRFKLYMLHSSLSAGQTEVFDPVPRGCRKIILATNIAETSITIPEVQYVIDTGKHREKQYDQLRRITKLACTWISKSSSKQRAGRAGRVQNGNYYALFSKARFDSLRAIGLPEILRSDLQEICLDIRAQSFQTPIREFLAEALEPPSPKAVDTSVLNLQALDALTPDEKITPLGRLLASLPVHPSLGKMIVLGVVFRCLDPILILGAATAERNVFVSPLGLREQAAQAKLSFADGSQSDHIAILNAVRRMRDQQASFGDRAMRNLAQEKFVHPGAVKAVLNTAQQIEDILVDAGLIPPTPDAGRFGRQYGSASLNKNSFKTPLIKALVLAGVHPNLALKMYGRTFRTPGESKALVHPGSVNSVRDKKNETYKYGTLYSYGSMVHSNDYSSIFICDTSESTPLMTTLFGGKITFDGRKYIEMDNWLPFWVKSMDPRAAKTLLEFRKSLERLLAGAFRKLSSRESKGRHQYGVERRYLADEKPMEIFAEALVDILDRDVNWKIGKRPRNAYGTPSPTREGNENPWISGGLLRYT